MLFIFPMNIKRNLMLIVCVVASVFAFAHVSAIAMGEKPSGKGERIRKIIIPEGLSKGEMIPEPESRGGSLFDTYCSQCHNLPNPVMYASDEWPVLFERMVQHARRIGHAMEGIVLPTVKEKENIITYLQRNGLKALPEDDPSLKGAEAFQFLWYCSICHAPPDPVLHTPEEWKKVVKRMNSLRARWGRPTMSKADMDMVLEFLSK
jgi:cytochrome c5